MSRRPHAARRFARTVGAAALNWGPALAGLLVLAAPAAGEDWADYDPFSFVNANYAAALFGSGDAGSGTTLGVSVSQSFGLSGRVQRPDGETAPSPFFLAVLGQASQADDELALPEFGGADVQLRQVIYRGSLVLGYNRQILGQRRTFFGLLGWETNDLRTSFGPLVFESEVGGLVYGAGVFVQNTRRNAVDVRIVRIEYEESDRASYTTYGVRNNYLLGSGFVWSVGVSLNESPSIDTRALHCEVSWLF